MDNQLDIENQMQQMSNDEEVEGGLWPSSDL